MVLLCLVSASRQVTLVSENQWGTGTASGKLTGGTLTSDMAVQHEAL